MRLLLCIILFFLIISPAFATDPTWIYSTKKGNSIIDIDLSSDGRYLAATDGSLYYFSNSPELLISGWTATKVDISKDSSLFTTASDINVCLFTIDGKREWCSDEFPGDPTEVIIASDNSSIYSSSSKNGKVYNFNRSGELYWNQYIGSPFYSLSAPSDGSFVAGSASYGRFFSINQNGKIAFLTEPSKGNNINIMQSVVSENGRYILGTVDYGTSGDLILSDKYGRSLWSSKTEGIQGRIAMSEDGSYIVAGVKRVTKNPTGILYQYQVNRTTNQASLAWRLEFDGAVQSVAITSNGSYIVAGCSDGTLVLIDKEGSILMNYHANEGITQVAISSDGTSFAAGTSGGIIVFFANNGGFSGQPTPTNGGISGDTPQVTSIIVPDITDVSTSPDSPGTDSTFPRFSLPLMVTLIFGVGIFWVLIFMFYKKREG